MTRGSSQTRLTVVMTHPIQYYSPWFRYIEREVDELSLTVVYASEPSPRQQGEQFDTEFTWDVPLREGYRSEVVRPSLDSAEFGSESFWGLHVPEIGDAVVKTDPDVVLLSGWHSITLVRAMLACRRREIPLLYRGDTHLASRESSVLWRVRTRWLLGRFDRYLSVGTRVHAYLTRFGVSESAIHPSPHAVDNDFFASRARPFHHPSARADARRELGIDAGAFVVLFVGKLELQKRLDDVLGALGRTERAPVLLVVGAGARETHYRDVANERSLDVCWSGFVNQSDLGRAYGVSDCLVLPGRESWGLVVNEAMACGLPCVVSDHVGCAPDLVDGTGEIFTYGDESSLARAIDRVRTDDVHRRACIDRVARFDFAAASEGLVDAARAARPL